MKMALFVHQVLKLKMLRVYLVTQACCYIFSSRSAETYSPVQLLELQEQQLRFAMRRLWGDPFHYSHLIY